jgi:hypothetical protein
MKLESNHNIQTSNSKIVYHKKILGSLTSSTNSNAQMSHIEHTDQFAQPDQPDDISNTTDSQVNKEKIQYMNDHIDPHLLADSGCMLTTDEYTKCIYEWVRNTGNMMDWTILNTMLNNDWTSFGLFGIEFSDASAIHKSISITVLLITSGSLVGYINH